MRFGLASVTACCEKLPLLALSAASCVVTLLAQIDAMGVTQYPFSVRLGNALVACAAYLEVSFGLRLAVLYPHPGSQLPIAKIMGSVVVLGESRRPLGPGDERDPT